ncbi:MAG TPA: dTMP kinase [Segeticoccus sp.]|uniref:dTMP kinase n=1 Tax=Segeticoccus sp. TaxID=2706531 RepID=UPI002D7E7E78|nr:dTMP kinase [Segeticoccus sp.]HET8601792.1 dTMP kinase [Segeticoccus sp.]
MTEQPRPPAPPAGEPSVQGLFVAFEGGDGAGKSTQARLLGEWLTAEGRTVQLTREPGGTDLGQHIRDLVLHGEDVAPRAEALLFAADRAHHVESLIRPALQRGEVVITDRYLDSSAAYQGAGRDLGADEIRDLSLWAVGGLVPDLTILIDLPSVVGRQRRGGVHDRLESIEGDFHERVRQHFLDLAQRDPGRYLVVDGELAPEAIQQQVRERVRAVLGVSA